MKLLAILTMTFLYGVAIAKQPDKIKIGLCTDVHLPTMHDSEYRMTTFIKSMKAEKPDFILEMGDFEIPDPKFAYLVDIWNSFPGEKFHVIGNHEMDGGTSKAKAVEYLKMKNSYYSFDRQGFHFIVLDGNDKKSPNTKGYPQFIGPEQVEWLKDDLLKAQHPMVIFSHQGLSRVKGAEEYYGVENDKQIQEILTNHNSVNPSNKVIACFNGHSHYDFAENVNGIWYITITSMAYHWLGDNYVNIRYSTEVDRDFKWIKYTAPFKEPLFTVVEISSKGTIKIAGKKTEWVGKTPWELGYPESLKKYMRPEITKRKLRF
jgi:predicted phosphodiesterase